MSVGKAVKQNDRFAKIIQELQMNQHITGRISELWVLWNSYYLLYLFFQPF